MNKEQAKKELQRLQDKYGSQGFHTSVCEVCSCIAVSCPECGKKACSGSTADCGTCSVTHTKQEKVWLETDELFDVVKGK